MSTHVDQPIASPAPPPPRAVLLAQHEHLRQLLAGLQRVADRVLRGESIARELTERLEEVRTAFAEHNATEEQMLEPILRVDFAWGPARIARMVEEHVAEHATLRAALDGPDLEVAARIGELIEDIDAHMAAEERTFLAWLMQLKAP